MFHRQDNVQRPPTIPIGDCSCVEQPRSRAKVPQLTRLKFSPEDVPRTCAKKSTCEDQRRADDDLLTASKSLPSLTSTECPPPEPVVPKVDMKVHRLPKFTKEDKVWTCKEQLCNFGIPRFDELEGYKDVKKSYRKCQLEKMKKKIIIFNLNFLMLVYKFLCCKLHVLYPVGVCYCMMWSSMKCR